MAGKWNKLLGLSWGERLLLLEAAASLAAARLAVLTLPFRWLAPRLGETMASTPADEPADPELVRRIGWAVGVASRHLPWPSRCLAEAIAAKAMLQRRAVASTLYIGLARGERADLESHAWLRCGSRILTGERASDGFEVIASFAEPPLDRR